MAVYFNNMSGIHDVIPNQNDSHNKYVSSKDIYGVESAFIMLLLVLEIPYAAILCRSLWVGAFTKDRPWPSLKALIFGVISSILESIGISIFLLLVLCESTPYFSALLMNGVFLVYIASHIFKLSLEGIGQNKSVFVIFVIALVIETGGLLCTFFEELHPSDHHGVYKRNKLWAVPASLICLSIAWCPAIQKAQLWPRQGEAPMKKRRQAKYSEIAARLAQRRQNRVDHLRSRSSNNSPTASEYSDQSDYGSMCSQATTSRRRKDKFQSIPLSELIDIYPEYSARWKISIINNILKLIFTPGCAMLLVYLTAIIDMKNMKAGFHHIKVDHPLFTDLLINIFTSLAGKVLGLMACKIGVQRIGFAFPLVLSTPVTLMYLILNLSCNDFSKWDCQFDLHGYEVSVAAASCLYLAQILSTSYFVFQSYTSILQKESAVFWLPGYNGIFLEQWMLLAKKNKETDKSEKQKEDKVKRSRVFICTTMYRESAEEMGHLLKSLSHINIAKQQSERFFQSHIFFDNGVRDHSLQPFALQLISVVENKLGITSENCTKMMTPYGMRLTWQLPSVFPDKQGMTFSIHLKDNFKVKNKKRWSQVMYMSYVLDYLMREDDLAVDEDTFILTTDADVTFRPESVEALLDLVSRDPKVGAVCARTHPMGSGPMVWYQKFDYAIGHWLQKTSNHVLGSVLCCPGCFSVYRAEALRHVLSTYATSVNKAMEFLTKDMGEDRWLCTLMVQSGWRLEYCAAAENRTNCPDDFEEFFKQRRRWIPSSLANLFLLLQEAGSIRKYNSQISLLFLTYQGALLMSTLISPAMCILIITGGLYYAWDVNQVVVVLLLVIIAAVYTLVCLFAEQKTQLFVGKMLTIILAFVMAAVVIGTAIQIVGELNPIPMSTTVAPYTPPTNHTTTTTTHPTPKQTLRFVMNNVLDKQLNNIISMHQDVLENGNPENILKVQVDGVTTQPSTHSTTHGPYSTPVPGEFPLPTSVTTLYLAGLIGIFILTAILHPSEAICILHGVWYLLCLPASFIVLTIYSICNITDKSWGTREAKSDSGQTSDSSRNSLWRLVKSVLGKSNASTPDEKETFTRSVQVSGKHSSLETEEPLTSTSDTGSRISPALKFTSQPSRSNSFQNEELEAPIPIADWFPRNFRTAYAQAFSEAGYEDTSFLKGVTNKDLVALGVKVSSHRRAILEEIRKLPEPEIDAGVPETVEEWLRIIKLSDYCENFWRLNIIRGRQLELLKTMTLKDIKNELHITKPGHQKRLLLAIKELRYPTAAEMEAKRIKRELGMLQTYRLESVNRREYDFWEMLRHERLLPDSVAFAQDDNLMEKLTDLRNSTIMLFVIANVLWLILIMTLVTKSQLNVLQTNILGLVFLIVFGLILVIQFVCMVLHRIHSWIHMAARAPFKCGQPSNITWSFIDSSVQSVQESQQEGSQPTNIEDSVDVEAARERAHLSDMMRRRTREAWVSNRARPVTISRQPVAAIPEAS